MSFTVLCTCTIAFYTILWFFDSFFRSCMVYPYFAFLEGTGLKIGILNFSWTTTAFNRFIYRWSKNLKRVLRRWFVAGYIVTIYMFLPFALWTLFTVIFEYFHQNNGQNNAPVEVKAVMPGINVPASDFFVYFISIAFCSLIHELGHALAAADEDVQVLSVGYFVCTIIPVAFVQLNTDHLNSLDIGRRLKVYCAGVWHNVATSLIAILLFISTPILFGLAYDIDQGVRIVDFTEDSPLKDVRGFDKGDVITSINQCEVKNGGDWQHCLHLAHERYGICITPEYVSQNDELAMETIKDNDVVECCRKDDIYSFCFEYIEPSTAVDSVLPGQYSCLKPRDMVMYGYEKCQSSESWTCGAGKHCLKPCLNNHTYLIIIERKDNNPVLYLGLPVDLHKTIIVDQYFPKSSLFEFFSPSQFEKLMKYIFIFSMGIGFLNIIPCYGTDGHHIARNIIQFIATYMKRGSEFVQLATMLTVFVGTAITVPMLMLLFYKAIYESD
ncbi:membrane-bound transcription factor site-2 protease [Hyposmocoma kahamanoa]|uniref:membrane-bound transcription factor site-2 protease n=1 Tax=Hyposmocoma kahamanoa TaxID=1477025 RepID=UPI000E6D9E9A|nr:membrane-bound transcription factor site-2 protease [Hyposmocoma kahamanoa]